MSLIAVLSRVPGLAGVALALDVGLGWLAAAIGVPLSLDVVGTATAGAVRGPLVGLVVGFAGGALVATLVPGAAPHGAAMVTHGIVGLAAAIAGRAGALRTPGRSVAAGGAVGVAVALAAFVWPAGGAVPLAVFVRGGSWETSFVVGAVAVAAEVVDKAVAFTLAGQLLRRLPANGPAPANRPGEVAGKRGASI